MSKFWQFLKDCKILSESLNLSVIDRLLQNIRQHKYTILKDLMYIFFI